MGVGDEQQTDNRVMDTLKITLNSSWLRLHKSIATPVNFLFKSKHEREQHRYEECLFLTQSGNNLIYTTLTGRYAVQQWEAVDFDLPWPITINTASVPYKINSNRACLEIPSCTGSALETFYDTNRPAFIKDSDLQTKIIAIDGRRANIEFIKPYGRLDKLNQIIKTVEGNPFTNPNQYQWFTRDNGGKIDYCEISKIYKTVLGQDVFEYEYLRYPGDTIIMQRINELHKAVDRYGTLERVVENGFDEIKYRLPIALFKKATQTVIWQGIPVRVK